MPALRLVVKVQRHLVTAHRDNDSGEFVFVLCRRGLEQALGRRLSVRETFPVEVTVQELTMPSDLVFNPDPSTQTLDAIWDALESSPAVTNRVKFMNRDKRMGDLAERTRRPDGDAQEDRFPAATVLPAGGLINITASSSSIEAQQNFELLLSVADARVDRQYFPLYWAIIAALAKASRNSGGTFGLPFIIGVAIRNYTAEENAQAILQGLTGWSSFITIEVKMRIRHDAIIATA